MKTCLHGYELTCQVESQFADLTCQVETSLEQVRRERHSGGYRHAETDRGDIVFFSIVHERTLNNPEEHYCVGAIRSYRTSSSLISHLKHSGTSPNNIQRLRQMQAKSKITLSGRGRVDQSQYSWRKPYLVRLRQTAHIAQSDQEDAYVGIHFYTDH